MKKNRRDFLKMASMAFVAANIKNHLHYVDGKKGGDHFNMSGFAAAPLPVIRIGFIGLGNRGPAAVRGSYILMGPESMPSATCAPKG
jgi:hypothetical protein